MADSSEHKKIIIECECGSHLLHISSHVDYYEDDTTNRKRYHQEICLAMFRYNNDKKRNVFQRLGICWHYLRTGKMHEDQLMLNYEEAKKLEQFLNQNIIEPDTHYDDKRETKTQKN